MLYVDRAPSARPEPFSVRFLFHSKKTKSERAAIAAAILGQWARSLWPDGCPNRSALRHDSVDRQEAPRLPKKCALQAQTRGPITARLPKRARRGRARRRRADDLGDDDRPGVRGRSGAS